MGKTERPSFSGGFGRATPTAGGPSVPKASSSARATEAEGPEGGGSAEGPAGGAGRGQPGGRGDRIGNFAVQNSDFILSVGSRLNIRQVGYNHKTWARGAFTVVCDIDSEELQKPSVHVDVPVHADAYELLAALDERLSELGYTGHGDAYASSLSLKAAGYGPGARDGGRTVFTGGAWKDGRTFRIDMVRDLVPASLYGEDYSGECYTVVIRGEERRLFFERSSGRQPNRFGRWFVEC